MSESTKSPEISDSPSAVPSQKVDVNFQISKGQSDPTKSSESEQGPATVTPAPLSLSRESDTPSDFPTTQPLIRLSSEFNEKLSMSEITHSEPQASQLPIKVQEPKTERKRRSRPPKHIRMAAQPKFDENSWADEVEKEELAEQRREHHIRTQRPKRNERRHHGPSAVGPSADASQVRMQTRIFDSDEDESVKWNKSSSRPTSEEKGKVSTCKGNRTGEGKYRPKPKKTDRMRASKNKKEATVRSDNPKSF